MSGGIPSEGRGARILFAALLLAHLVPIWAFDRFPSQDGSPHLFNAELIRTYETADAAVYREHFSMNLRPDPTWFGHLLLAILQTVFPPLVSEKILVSIYTLLLPLAARYALVAVDARAGPLALLAFPFVHNWFLHMGFFAFSLSLPMALFVLGYWWKHADALHARRIAVLGALTLLLYLNHVFALLIVWISLALLGLLRCVEDRREGIGLATIAQARVVRPMIAFAPTLVLVAIFFLPQEVIRSGGRPIPIRLEHLVKLITAASFDVREVWLTGALVALLGIATVGLLLSRRDRSLKRADGFWVVLFVLGLLYVFGDETQLVTPSGGVGGGLFHLRLSLFPFFILMLWFAAQSWPRRLARATLAGAVIIAVGLLALHNMSYRTYNEALDDLLTAAPFMEAGETLLMVDISDGTTTDSRHDLRTPLGNPRADPLKHASHYLALERGIVPLDNYEADVGYFPFVFHESVNPYRHLGDFERRVPELRLADYPGRLDFVMIRRGPRPLIDHPNVEALQIQLADAYRKVHVSPKGLYELYERRTPAESDG